MKCQAYIDDQQQIPCTDEAEYWLYFHSNIYAGLVEVNCPRVLICEKHKILFEQPQFRGDYSKITRR